MDDQEAYDMLCKLHKYVETFKPDLPQTIPSLAEDLVDGMSTSFPNDIFARAMLEDIRKAYP